mmetsp:Transcript_45342/g.119779  ORF Transcript_45342/g.119779 Transcript_45342/m.119779 type:complete len:208 (-) Transcript_45342:715-1338(-)
MDGRLVRCWPCGRRLWISDIWTKWGQRDRGGSSSRKLSQGRSWRPSRGKLRSSKDSDKERALLPPHPTGLRRRVSRRWKRTRSQRWRGMSVLLLRKGVPRSRSPRMTGMKGRKWRLSSTPFHAGPGSPARSPASPAWQLCRWTSCGCCCGASAGRRWILRCPGCTRIVPSGGCGVRSAASCCRPLVVPACCMLPTPRCVIWICGIAP